jgi:lipopolysaccharide transport system ATP-binding protein
MGHLRVRNLGKAYKRYPKKWGRLAEWVGLGVRHDLNWVLRDVTFDVAAGEAVGIIGSNGAGKSTLLKLVTGTIRPTIGAFEAGGRIAALLELGIGFHPEFTGRQNVFMAGHILGIPAERIAGLMPEIEAFAEIGAYIDEPVRVYSSGMQMRLAFSVATAARPDVLIVDEALSVGDTYFQHKSFDRIRAFRAQGTTLLLVSHDKSAIQSICDEAILLHEGRLAMHGEPETVMDYYNALIAEKENSTVRQRAAADGRTQTISGSGEVALAHVALHGADGRPAETIATGEAVAIEVEVDVHAPIDSLVVGYMIKDRVGQPVFGTNTHHLKRTEGPLAEGDRVRLRFAFPANIGEGSYSVAIAAHDAETHISRNYEWRDLALVFKVINTDKPRFVGSAWLPTTVDIEVTSREAADSHE